MHRVAFVIYTVIITCYEVNMLCVLEEKSSTPKCRGEMRCVGNINGMNSEINKWICVNNNYYYNGRREYEIVLELDSIDIRITENPLLGLQEFAQKIKSLSVHRGNLVTVPFEVYTLHNIKDLILVHSNIEIINLNRLASLNMLLSINVSHNAISEIETTEWTTDRSVVKYIDLSYNELQSLNDNSFIHFPQLNYLDLSNNKISKLDILTFEGTNQLQTLLISNNQLLEYGQSFARFSDLKNLRLDNNLLTKITEVNLKALLSLERLNLSTNEIGYIEGNSFYTLQNLEEIDLSHNKINTFGKNTFRQNNRISTLLLSHNNIQHIEKNTFENNHITNFQINNNSLTGSIEEKMFTGVFVTELDLSGGKLSQLQNNAFAGLEESLVILNLSNNMINNISFTSFYSLDVLEELDLSNNQLEKLDFDTSGLKNLTIYHLKSNKISKILKDSFNGLSSLIKLDLSYNEIEEIALESFMDVINLEELYLNNNKIQNSLLFGTFTSLRNLQYLQFMYTRLSSYANESLSGMTSLKRINSSYSGLLIIEFDTFKDTGSIEVMDFSHNLLESFHVNTSHFLVVQELYLNNNLLRNITSETFRKLNELRKLNLAYNNIIIFDSKGTQSLINLNILNISMNNNMIIDARMFNNLPYLSEVSLNNIERPFSFNVSLNASIDALYLSHCNIIEIGSLQVYKVMNVLLLDLSNNRITYLDKGSFESMPYLNHLDLSCNLVNYIQPGTFLQTQTVKTIYLDRNSLLSIEFGALDGLKTLEILNLSSNAIHTFSPNLLHSITNINHLSLDNNNIAQIDIGKFANIGLRELSIGGNPIPCDTFASKELPYDDFVVTASHINFHSENVNGIMCKTSSKPNQTIYENNYSNVTFHLLSLIEKQENLFKRIEEKLNNTVSLNISDIQSVFSNLTNNLRDTFDRQAVGYNQWKNSFSNVSNIWFSYFTNITAVTNKLLEVINNITQSKPVAKNEDYRFVTNTIKESLEEIKKINLKQIDTIQNTENAAQTQKIYKDSSFSDIKVLLYLITIFLALIFLAQVSLFTFKQLQKHGWIGSHNFHIPTDGQSIANIMELN